MSEKFQEKWQELQSLENKRLAEQREVRQEKALKAVNELLDFVDNCRPSRYAYWRDCEKRDMVEIVLNYL